MNALVLIEDTNKFYEISEACRTKGIEVVPISVMRKVVSGAISCNFFVADWDTLVSRSNEHAAVEYIDNNSLEKSILITNNHVPSAEILSKFTHTLESPFTTEQLVNLL